MDKKNFFRRNPFSIIDERPACAVCAKLELLNVAADALRWFVGVERHFTALSRLSEKASWRVWVGIANKKN